DPADRLYGVQSGAVKLYKTGEEGRPTILKLAGPGDILEMPPLLRKGVFISTAEVVTEGTVRFVEREIVLETLKKEPNLELNIIQYLSDQVSDKYKNLFEMAHDDGIRRLARFLYDYTRKFGKTNGGGHLHADLPLSREELAELIGTVPETATRLIKKLRERKLIDVKRRSIAIDNPNRLAHFIC
ncbi:MAG: Crp/Fnr family transcriptional regulator, partial [Deltaproteobacteria bacterium]|nr:Crp/Fnr family transcriptional regulator [Deltaproteobacteria bacterium]